MGKAAPQENAQEIMTLKQDIAGRVSQAVGAMDNISQFIAPLQQSTDPADKKVAQWIEDVEDKLEFLATQLEQHGSKGAR
jgi:flagellar biosynthesis chaperone FliJ